MNGKVNNSVRYVRATIIQQYTLYNAHPYIERYIRHKRLLIFHCPFLGASRPKASTVLNVGGREKDNGKFKEVPDDGKFGAQAKAVEASDSAVSSAAAFSR